MWLERSVRPATVLDSKVVPSYIHTLRLWFWPSSEIKAIAISPFARYIAGKSLETTSPCDPIIVSVQLPS